MNKGVIYQSGTGFTAKYAGWIAERLGCEAKEYKSVNPKELTDYDMVIYGGWIFGGQIMGLKEIREVISPFAVFAVGCSPSNFEEVVNQIKIMNSVGLENQTPFFYFEGGLHFKQLGFFKKFILFFYHFCNFFDFIIFNGFFLIRDIVIHNLFSLEKFRL